jgi:ABC-type phosphate transport system ATPase subunit
LTEPAADTIRPRRLVFRLGEIVELGDTAAVLNDPKADRVEGCVAGRQE